MFFHINRRRFRYDLISIASPPSTTCFHRLLVSKTTLGTVWFPSTINIMMLPLLPLQHHRLEGLLPLLALSWTSSLDVCNHGLLNLLILPSKVLPHHINHRVMNTSKDTLTMTPRCETSDGFGRTTDFVGGTMRGFVVAILVEHRKDGFVNSTVATREIGDNLVSDLLSAGSVRSGEGGQLVLDYGYVLLDEELDRVDAALSLTGEGGGREERGNGKSRSNQQSKANHSRWDRKQKNKR
ncbi:MAG: hypothetical protein J3R72DRAFT_461415 [Linnemannia gamsii]|nr:MAG: hypothetical protein J3R72DRAFT_461415 [Linnemannia gamsii]